MNQKFVPFLHIPPPHGDHGGIVVNYLAAENPRSTNWRKMVEKGGASGAGWE
ncbi:MAG: hypothetical protein NTV33_04645 [Coprothermobacterota bacterium]|nr:hypothetical protein [Coprothermobacterota bacterium]